MKDSLYIALDNCLTMMDQGSDLESCLVRYPEYAAELRPLLLAALDAGSIAENYVPVEVQRQGKVKFLNAAAQIREQRSSKKLFGLFPIRRAVRFSFATLVVAVFVVGIGGTGLVNASGGSLPGDRLYPVKLSWENIQLNLVLAQSERDVLIDKFDQERVHEVNALINSKRLENVGFYGQIEGIFPTQIIVSGVTVAILPSTKIDGGIQMNAFARVEGHTQPDGVVLADKIQIESKKLEDGNNAPGNDMNSNSSSKDLNQSGGNSGEDKPGITPAPEIEQTMPPDSEDTVTTTTATSATEITPWKEKSTPETRQFEIEGNISSYNGSTIEVSGKSIFIIPETELKGTPSGGSKVSIHGYINKNGDLIAQSIEVQSESSSGGGGGQSGGGGGSDGSHHHYDPSRTPDPNRTPEPDD
jgi:uncharacterized membrane protein YgcG